MASEVTIRCKEGNASVTLTPTDLDKVMGDIKNTISPAGEICMTKGRLQDIVERSKLVDSDTNLCSTPRIVKHEVVKTEDGYILNVEMTDYESLLAYPYGGTVIAIKPVDENLALPIGYKDKNIVYGDKFVNKISLEIHPEMINMNLEFRVGYLTGKVMVGSAWESLRINQATVIGPDIEPLTEDAITYQERPPYGFSFNVKSVDKNTNTNITHKTTTWRIYKKNLDKLELVWSKAKVDLEKEEIRIANLVPQYLAYGNTYYLTAEYQYDNGEYSAESTPLEFTLNGIIVNPPPCVDVYPRKLTISNPTLACSDDIDVQIGKKIVKLDITSMEMYYWEIRGPKGTKKYTSLINQIQLGYMDLEPNTVYDLFVTYKHKNLGLSPVSKITFKTEPKFRVDPANLDTPIRIHKQNAFFGEILQKDLMHSDVNYRGVYDDKEEYKVGDEVNKEGELYICKRNKKGSEEQFRSCFEKADSSASNSLYKSELPTYRWLLRELGFNPYLSLGKIPNDETLSNYLHPETGTWIKCQNRLGRVIYISKFNIYTGVSHNDLIRTGVYHPKRRTVRIRNRLYYARLLTTTMETYYDPIDPIKKDKINSIYGSNLVNVGEDELMTYLLNGRLNNYVSTDIDSSTLEYKEIVYGHNKCLIGKISTGSTVTFSVVESTKIDSREYSVRLVLEEIPSDELPIYNINPNLPGGNGKRDDKGNLYEYDPYADVCYLDFVTVDNFLSSESINEKTGMFMETCVPNTGWHKIYCKGLVYYVSQGQNYINANLEKIESMNMLSPTPIYRPNNMNLKPENIKYCKVVLNGLIFNVTLPDIVNYISMHEIWNVENSEYNILNGKYNKDLKISDKSFWSNSVYRVIKDREDSPKPNKAGYKGVYPKVHKEHQTVDYIVNSKPNGWLLTSKKLMKEDKSLNYLLNSENDTYVMKEYVKGDEVNVLLVLTISPTVGNEQIWDLNTIYKMKKDI